MVEPDESCLKIHSVIFHVATTKTKFTTAAKYPEGTPKNFHFDKSGRIIQLTRKLGLFHVIFCEKK